jgi:hypothetical protein
MYRYVPVPLPGSSCTFDRKKTLTHFSLFQIYYYLVQILFFIRKNEIFWPGLEAFIRLCLQHLLISTTRAAAAKHLTEILAQEADLTPALMGQFVEVRVNSNQHYKSCSS